MHNVEVHYFKYLSEFDGNLTNIPIPLEKPVEEKEDKEEKKTENPDDYVMLYGAFKIPRNTLKPGDVAWAARNCSIAETHALVESMYGTK